MLQFLIDKQLPIDGVLLDPDTNLTLHLAEIHAAPHWLWVALVKQMIESGWTVQVTRDKVGAFRKSLIRRQIAGKFLPVVPNATAFPRG